MCHCLSDMVFEVQVLESVSQDKKIKTQVEYWAICEFSMGH